MSTGGGSTPGRTGTRTGTAGRRDPGARTGALPHVGERGAHAGAAPAGTDPAPGSSGGGGGGEHGGGQDSDQIYREVLRRIREEQEQISQLISHPF